MTDPLETLERLARLRSMGALTDEEFAAEKARILAQPVETQSEQDTNAPHQGYLEHQSFVRQRPVAVGLAAATFVSLALAAMLGFDVGTSLETASNDKSPEARSQELAVEDQSTDNLLIFDDPAVCEPGNALEETLAQLARQSVGTKSMLELRSGSEPIQPQVERFSGASGSGVIRQIPLDMDWNGLKVTALRTSEWDNGSASTLQIRFADSANQAKSSLQRAGFNLGPIGEPKRVRTPAEGTLAIGIETLSGGSALTCFRDQEGAASTEQSSA